MRQGLTDALRAAHEEPRPAVLGAIVNRVRPLSGGDAVGWWDVPVPEYLPDQRAVYEAGRDEEALY